MPTIALDAMGADHAPKAEVEGAVRAARSFGVNVMLVGQREAIAPELEQHEGYRQLPIEIVHASERVTMDEVLRKHVERGAIQVVRLIEIQILCEDLQQVRAALGNVVRQKLDAVLRRSALAPRE